MKRLLLINILILSLTIEAQSYETNVHEAITSRAITSSNIESYLKNNFNINLLDNFNSRTAQKWIELGSVWEDDDLTMRWLNHFYDPTTGLGLHGIVSGKPSLQWAKDYANNEWDWNRARYNYSSALTSTNKTDRENAFARVFRALGHIIHLIEDKSVPAHVRNDAHPYYFENHLQQQRDMYEKYTRFNMGALKYNGYSAVDLTTFNTLNSFWINSGKGLAEYTNRNYVSRDTNFDDPEYSHYNTPIAIEEWITTEEVTDPDLGKLNVEVRYLQGYATDNYRPELSLSISRLSAFSFFDYEANKYLGKPGVYSLNNYVHKDYAALLIPRAVGYSAGLLNYFFRGSIDMVRDTENDACKYVVYNFSNENMEGTFGLYYDDASGNRTSVASGALAANAGKPSNPITLNLTDEEKEKSKYILVFQGKMGNETGAVVADANVTPFTSSCGKELTITGPATTSKNSTELYTVSGCTGCSDDVTWAVSGAGASIETSSDGIDLKNSIKLTTDETACGTITITASCPGCGINATKTVTISDTLEITETATPDCYAVKDGTGSYTWSITKGTIDEKGCANLTGQCGTATITVTDTCGNTGTKDLQLPASLAITGPDAGKCYTTTGTEPYIWNITKGSIDTKGCVNLTGQCGTATISVTNANGCMGTKELNLSAENCSSLTIVNENGTPATDTILRGGSKDYKTTGKCCENITWSVSAASGSSKGSAAITSAGVLTASGACGTLIVTATCAGCGTSATQDVKVTNNGGWVLIQTQTQPPLGGCCGAGVDSSSGFDSNNGNIYYKTIGRYLYEVQLPGPCTDYISLPDGTSVTFNTGARCYNDPEYNKNYKVSFKNTYEWKCP